MKTFECTEAELEQAEAMAAEHNKQQRLERRGEMKCGSFVSPWIDHPRMPEADAFAELWAVGIPVRPWQGFRRALYLNDGTNCSLSVDRAGTVRELDVWHAIWCWVTGRKMWSRTDTCPSCGDGVERGHHMCSVCERKRAEPASLPARTDNWRAATGTGTRKSTRRGKPSRMVDIIARGGVRCMSCYGHIGKTQYGTPCKPCGQVGWVMR